MFWALSAAESTVTMGLVKTKDLELRKPKMETINGFGT